jgi:hypothetical protein
MRPWGLVDQLIDIVGLVEPTLAAVPFSLRRELWLGLCVEDSFGQHFA